MNRFPLQTAAIVVLALATAACDVFQTPASRAAAARRDSITADSALRATLAARAESLRTSREEARWALPAGPRGVAGITLTVDGRMLVSDNESGNVSEVDYRDGRIVKTFRLGRQAVHGDFVGLTTTGDGGAFQIDRSGTIYHFLEGGDRNRVEFLKHETKLAAECEFGGVAFDSDINSLVLACSRMKRATDSLSLYLWRLDRPDGERLSDVTIPIAELVADRGWSGFHPSDITIDPATGNYVLVSAREHGIAEITPQGAVEFVASLPGEPTAVAGVAITRGGTLLVAAGTGADANVTRYRWR